MKLRPLSTPSGAGLSWLVTCALVLGIAAAPAAATSGTTTAPACPTDNPPTALSLVAGTPQSAQLGKPFETELQVALTNPNGCPITTPLAGVAVSFTAPATGPSGTFSASGSNAVLVGTDASGTARASLLTANMLPGGYLVTASSSFGSVTFSLVNTASGVPAVIDALSPSSESAAVATPYPVPLQVRVLDANGNPVQGIAVTFTLGTGAAGGSGAAAAGASFDGGGPEATELTTSDGVATSPRFVAGTEAGTFVGTATAAGLGEPATFALRNLSGPPPRVSAVGRLRYSTRVDARYSHALEVKVVDGNGRAEEGVTVTFAIGQGGATGSGAAAAQAGATFTAGLTQATATTNSAGIASSPSLRANSTAGTFTATASATGVSKSLSFMLRNRPGPPATISVGAAATESTPVGARFPIPLAVTVTDKYGNAVVGVPVRFAAPRRGASGTFVHRHRRARTVTAKTNLDGIAVAPPLQANVTTGGYVVTVTAGNANKAAFALVNKPRL